jgi:hypothetical protein
MIAAAHERDLIGSKLSRSMLQQAQDMASRCQKLLDGTFDLLLVPLEEEAKDTYRRPCTNRQFLKGPELRPSSAIRERLMENIRRWAPR